MPNFRMPNLTECRTGTVCIKPLCSKKLILKLIRFQGYTQTSFLVSSAVYLTFLRIDFSTITQVDTGGGDVVNVNYEAELKIEKRNLCKNRYEHVLVILKKKVNFMSKKTQNI